MDLVDSEDCDSPERELNPNDEFAQFVKASMHPPNELSVPRCYPDVLFPGLAKQKTIHRSRSACSSTPEPSQRYRSSSSYPSSPRPRLRREAAQDMEYDDISTDLSDKQSPNSSALSASRYSSLSVSPQLSRSPSPMDCKYHLSFHHRSAPGSPGIRRTPSRTPSSELGYLRVPLSRARGTSLPENMEESLTKNKFYLLKQFNIQGGKVINLGDSFQQQDTSNNSINSYLSPR